jgi:hypothetical protein
LARGTGRRPAVPRTEAPLEPLDESLSVELEIGESDWRAFNQHVVRRIRGPGLRALYVAYGLAFWGALVVLVAAALGRDGADAPRLALALLALALIAQIVLASRTWRAHRPRPRGFCLGPQRLDLDATGILVTGGSRRAHHDWSLLLAVDETRSHVFLFVDTGVAHIVPKRALTGGTLVRLRELVARYAPAVAWSGAPGATEAAEGEEGPTGLPAVGANLRAGLRLALLARPGRFRATGWQLLALLALDAALLFLIDYATVPAPRYYDDHAVAIYAARLFAVVVAFYAGARVFAPRVRVDGALAAFAAALVLPLCILGLWLWRWPLDAGEVVGAAELAGVLWLVWIAVLAARAFAAEGLDRGPGRWLALLMVGGLVFVSNVQLRHTQLWWASPEDAQEEVERIDVESTYYAQDALVDDRLAELAPQRAGVVDLYFVGFGGDASQDVFLKEVRYVRDLFDRRFDTSGRSLILINHASTVEDTPLANAHNLERILRGVGSVIDPEEDLVFLYLTSHGSRNAELTVRFWPLALNDLPAEELRQMIEASGIRFRVVAISACYSGAFLDELEAPEALVMTAASRDRPSFGCGRERDFTYFGEALFRDQLEHDHSFTRAFDRAREALEARETAEGVTPSNPQISIGKAIAGKLARLERRLDAPRGTPRRRASSRP